VRYGSVCSGIEAATVAWDPLGWTPAFFSEIEKFPRAVLQHHYPKVPLHGDFTTIKGDEYGSIDLLVGGTPCQSFSVAGLRKGLDDARGNLALEYLRLVDRTQPRWIVWENVPGVLSSNKGRDFGAFLGALVELGYGFAYRVLDAQYFGVAQRRRRVFVVGYLGDWRPAAAVLFERESLCGNSAPSREAGSIIAPTIRSDAPNGGKGHGARSGDSKDELITVSALTANGVGTCGADDNQGQAGHLVAHTLRGEGFDASEDGTGRGVPLVPTVAPCLTSTYGKQPDNSDTNAGPMLVSKSAHEPGYRPMIHERESA
jgi:DNA (cytosine-5)-methyltransferase 1